MSISKAEVYKMVIDSHVEQGQGLSGIVKLGKYPEISNYLNELVEEGLIEINNTGGSIGHPFSNEFYSSTKGYNVWKDGVENGNGCNNFLNHIRLYLGKLSEDENRSAIQKAINPTSRMLIQNAEFMNSYSEWLNRNKKELEKLLKLNNNYQFAR